MELKKENIDDYEEYLYNQISNSGFVIVDEKIRNKFNIKNLITTEKDKDIKNFIQSWNFLGLDEHMHDNGKYRFRTHGVFTAQKNTLKLNYKEKIPHFQKKQYNNVNGDIERWFKKIEPNILKNNFFNYLIVNSLEHFEKFEKIKEIFDNSWNEWFIEIHQFRILASKDLKGLPTPEGIHTDGVSYIFILAINRENISGGESEIYTKDKNKIATTILNKGDCIYLDDTSIMHSVTSISSQNNSAEAFRDTLVITFFKR